ncbi:LPXTG cell wall anchor domain-containing protein [Rhizobium helianthi]|uniref:LPXTG cell wall anchor domain-containing protein n=1 Tax=Rhizobium helianthi TaxID=1132695 RepID=A0ABW4M608_9HYPH
MADNLWFIAVALGPVLLGGAIVFAMMRRRRFSQDEIEERRAANHDLYDRPQSR